MRVISGRFGGRRLRAPAGMSTRPTAERVREALFSILGDMDGTAVLDLYAGSGALGIEALSRGATRAVFVERASAAVGALSANLEDLGVGASEAQVRRQDVRAALRTARSAGETYDLIFIDPPYRHAPELGTRLSAAIVPLLAPGARVICESERRAPMALDLPLSAERRYGDTLIRIHHRP